METEIIKTILTYLLHVITATFMQLLVLLGPLLGLALIMHFVARNNEKVSHQLFGHRGYLYLFGWLGTTVHELGHAIFAFLFGHKIRSMVLFNPDVNSGSLGHVSHSYNRSNAYQNIGNFFIGIGPILFGSIVLFLVSYLLLGINVTQLSTVSYSYDSLLSLSTLKENAFSIWESTMAYVHMVFTNKQSSWWKIILLIYILFAVGSSITLSKADVRGATGGFIYFVVLLFFFNLATLWIGDFTINMLSNLSNIFSGFYFLILLSIIVNLFFILIIGSLTLVFRRM